MTLSTATTLRLVSFHLAHMDTVKPEASWAIDGFVESSGEVLQPATSTYESRLSAYPSYATTAGRSQPSMLQRPTTAISDFKPRFCAALFHASHLAKIAPQPQLGSSCSTLKARELKPSGTQLVMTDPSAHARRQSGSTRRSALRHAQPAAAQQT